MSKKKISVRKILSFICGVVVLVFIISTIYTAKSQDKTKNVINIFGYRPVVVVSGSMEPDILTNSISIMRYCSMEDISVGDIIMYHHPSLDINITHRVVDIYENANGEIQYITQGDANNIEDSTPIIYENIEGKYIGKIPQVGRIVLALKSKTTLGIVLAILILLYIWEQRTNSKKIRRNNERIEYEKQKNKTV